MKNGYPKDVVDEVIYSSRQSYLQKKNKIQVKLETQKKEYKDIKILHLSYIRGISGKIERRARKINIRTVF